MRSPAVTLQISNSVEKVTVQWCIVEIKNIQPNYFDIVIGPDLINNNIVREAEWGPIFTFLKCYPKFHKTSHPFLKKIGDVVKD